MAPIVLNMCHLLGLSLIGDPFGPDYPDLMVSFSVPSSNSSYSDFVAIKNKREDPVTDREFCSFILYWLCKFLFCTFSQKIMPKFVPLAKALASKKRIALAPYVLGYIYRVCSRFCKRYLEPNQGGPIWVLQLWLLAYFTDFHSCCLKCLVQESTTYGKSILESHYTFPVLPTIFLNSINFQLPFTLHSFVPSRLISGQHG